MIKALRKPAIEGLYLNIIKGIYDKTIANIILNREKLKPFPLKSGMTQRYPLSTFLSNTDLEFLVRAIRHKEKMKRLQIGKEIVIVSVFADNMILYLKDPKTPPKK
jgi:hypothetical protein